MSDRVDDTFELKPHFKDEINKKLRKFYLGKTPELQISNKSIKKLITEKGIEWFKLNHIETYRKIKSHISE